MTFDRDSVETKKFFSCFGHWSLSLQSLSFPCESNLHSAHKHLTFATLNNTENERPKTVKCKNREMKKEKKRKFLLDYQISLRRQNWKAANSHNSENGVSSHTNNAQTYFMPQIGQFVSSLGRSVMQRGHPMLLTRISPERTNNAPHSKRRWVLIHVFSSSYKSKRMEMNSLFGISCCGCGTNVKKTIGNRFEKTQNLQ